MCAALVIVWWPMAEKIYPKHKGLDSSWPVLIKRPQPGGRFIFSQGPFWIASVGNENRRQPGLANFCQLFQANPYRFISPKRCKIGLMETKNLSLPSALRVLVVDDHPSTANTLARAISQLSPRLEVLSALSAENALALVQDKPIDFLITDMMMTGMNGLELIEKLQSHPAGRPSYVMLITAYDIPGLKITARRLHVNEIVIKPARPERVCQLISRAMEELGNDSPAPVRESKNALKILVADDLPDNVSLLTRYLSNEGYTCITAADGAEALLKARAEFPDMILLDMNMPVKDGFETLQEIRSDPAIGHIPVIILTAARLEPMDMQSALNMGADDYITKPFDRRELLARIRTRLRGKEAEDIIRRRNKELNLLPEIGRELSARFDVATLTDMVLRRTVETLGALVGHFVLFEEKGDVRTTHYAVSEKKQPGQTVEIPDLKPILAQIKESSQGIVINDTRKDARWSAAPNDMTRSAVIAPMMGRSGILGLFILAHEEPGYFSLEHMLLLQALASQAAIAMENARMLARLEKIQVELVTGVLQGMTEPVSSLKNLSKLIEQVGPLNDNQKMYLKRMVASINLLDDQVGKLLVSARQDLATFSAPPVR